MRPLAAVPGIRVIANGDVWQTSSPPAVAAAIMGELVIVAEVNSIARLGRPVTESRLQLLCFRFMVLASDATTRKLYHN